MKTKIMIQDNDVVAVLADEEAMNTDIDIEIVRFDTNMGDEKKWNQHFENNEFQDTSFTLTECIEYGSENEMYTEEESRKNFVEYIHTLSEYWSHQNGTVKDKLDGLAFSILTTLDGNAAALPGFKVSPICLKDDIDFARENGDKFYNNKIDIAGGLHGLYANYKE